ncbi:hypothetical protein CHUAL_007654 [Chamberlinius hualienensis]
MTDLCATAGDSDALLGGDAVVNNSGSKGRVGSRRTPKMSPPDLIELASSSEDLSDSSDYKSCDDDQQLKCAENDEMKTNHEILNLSVVLLNNSSSSSSTSSNQQRECDGEDDDEDENDLKGSKGCLSIQTLRGTIDSEAGCYRPDQDGNLKLSYGRLQGQNASSTHLSVASSSSDLTVPTCRICHLPGREENKLISPCRCSGTMQYIHTSCLMKWLEVSSRKSKHPPSCELCLYQYHRHKKFRVKHWHVPSCSLRDKILHVVFFLSLLTMIGSATVTILCFKHDKGGRVNLDKNHLTHSEIVTLVCGVLFFVAFFLAMYVEVKARSTIYKLILDFFYVNQQWYIDEYDKKADLHSVPV